jgi:hypothetical protein
LLQEAETKIEGLERQVGSFEFLGYFRSGYGLKQSRRTASCLSRSRRALAVWAVLPVDSIVGTFNLDHTSKAIASDQLWSSC